MLILQKVEFENFLSFRGKHSFNYAQKGIHLIKGINKDNIIEGDTSGMLASVGSGKSTFCVLPRYAFFGTINKDVNRKNIINKTAKKNTRVTLYFELNGTDYKIDRFRKYKKYKNDLHIYEKRKGKWANITRSDKRETQKFINELIIINEDTFRKSILLSRDDYDQLLEFDTRDRGKIFENIIQLSKFKQYHKKATEELREIKDDLNDVVTQIIAKNSENATYTEHLQDEEIEIDKKVKEIKLDLKNINEKMKIYSSSKMSSEEILENSIQYFKLANQIKKVEESSTIIQTQWDNMQKIVNNAQKHTESVSSQLSSARERLQNLTPIKCWNCGATQNEDEILEQVKCIEEEIKRLEEEYDECLKTDTDYTAEFTELTKQDYNLGNELIKFKTELKKINLPKKIIELIQEDVDDEEDNSIAEEIKTLHNQKDIKEAELNAVSYENIKRLKNTIKENDKDLNKLRKQKVKLEKKRDILNFWIQTLDFKNENSIKQHVIGQVLPVYNNIIQQNMNKIYNGSLSLVFDQFFKETIIYNDDEYLYDELSTGEKVKANLGINLSTFDMVKINLNGSSVIFLDELFTSVDPPTIKAGLNLIEEKYAKDSAVYLISHRPEIIEYINPDSVIQIVKENKDSKIIKGAD